ncbi:MAG TPA: MFS transporter [Candidatus Acidoferrales bacterium]|nr:MFS transporter [Candidatus Acidoferrales bacterium]
MASANRRIDVRASLKASFKDGVFAAVMAGITEYYAVPFALFLEATPQQVGWVSAFPALIGSLAQLFAVRLIDWTGGRLRLLTRAVFAQATLLLALSVLACVRFAYRVETFIALLVLATLCGAIAGPAWGSLMSDYIPTRKRGQYFGWRNQRVGLVNVASVICGGLLLYWSRQISTALGFLLLFVLAALARFISGSYIARMSEPPMKRDPAADFTFWMFVARFKESNFVKFVAFIATLTFATYLAGPFFAVFMLRDLQLSYLTYTGLQVASAGSALAALPLWGRHADLVGNVRVLRLAAFLVTLNPLFWLVSQNVVYLALVQAFAGFAWAGVTLSATNFIYDAVMPQKRARCIGYFNVINGTALFLGAALGGFLATRVPLVFEFPLQTLFLLSASLRLFFYLLLFQRFCEVRPSRAVSLQELFFSVVGIRPLIGAERE